MSADEFGDWAALYALEKDAVGSDGPQAEEAPDLKEFMRRASG